MTTNAAFGNWNAADFWRPWLQLAPASLIQPVLPGWTFNINSNNSTAPQTEVNVVARHSYGRQIGRISDALRALLLRQDEKTLAAKPFADFLSMWDEVEQVKTQSAEARLKQIAFDLALLQKTDRDQYVLLRDALRKALADAE